MTNGEDSAQPLSHETILRIESGFWYSYGLGLTKREYFAAIALQGILSNNDISVMKLNDVNKAHYACIMADNLIKALNDKP